VKVEELEEKLLSCSTSEDVVVLDDTVKIDGVKELSPEQIRKEVSVFARILVNGYCGWPFHSKPLKQRVLSKLDKLFDADTPMSVDDFFEKLGDSIVKVPDRHIKVKLGDRQIEREKDFINVGDNVGKGADYKIENSGDFAIIAVTKSRPSWDRFMEQAKTAIDNAKAVIIDLRGNGGGSSLQTSLLAEYLYGADTPGCTSVYLRGTPEGAILREGNGGFGTNDFDLSKDPFLYWTSKDTPYPEFSGIKNPVYILTDRKVGSAAEMFITQMSRHPYLKIVGTNTAGCEIYGQCSRAVLPNTGIALQVGNKYRELEAGNIELKGYAPHIRVQEGSDALSVAKADFYKTRNLVKKAGCQKS